MRSILLSLLLLISAGACAQESLLFPESEKSGIAIPDVLQLDGGWWDYFAGAGDDYDARRTAFIAQLRDRIKTLPAAERDAPMAAIQRIDRYLAAYRKLSGGNPPVITTPPEAQHYSLDDLYRLDAAAAQIKVRRDDVKDDLRRLDTAIKRSADRLDDARVRYANTNPATAERIGNGLILIQTRIVNEAAIVEDQQTRARLEMLQRADQAFAGLLRDAGARLQITPEALRSLRAEQSDLQARFRQGDAASAQDGIAAPGLGAQINEEFQQAVLLLKDLEVSIGAYLNGESGDVDSTLRNQLHDAGQFTERLQGSFPGWWRGIERLRLPGANATQDKTTSTEVDSRADRLSLQLDRLEIVARRVTLLSNVAQERLMTEQGGWRNWLFNTEVWLRDSWDNTRAGFSYTLFTLGETPVTTLGLLRVLLIVTVAWWLSKLLRGGLRRLGERRETISQSSLYALGRMLHYVILAVGFVIGLSSIGLNFTKFALLVSALGVGIGFGLQNMVSNFVSGLIILFERSLKVGDFVELESGVVGEVREINIRSTRITTNDNVDILVPNSEFVNGRVTNWTLNDALRRIHVPFGVAYGTDKELVKRAVLEAADNVPHTLTDIKNKQPDVWLVGFGDSSLDFELVLWLKPTAVKSPSRVTADYLWAIETALGKHGIEIPFPQRDLHLRSFFGKHDTDALSHIDRLSGDPAKS